MGIIPTFLNIYSRNKRYNQDRTAYLQRERERQQEKRNTEHLRSLNLRKQLLDDIPEYKPGDYGRAMFGR